MNKKRYYFLVFVIVFQIQIASLLIDAQSNPKKSKPEISQLKSHEPIRIENTTDFITQAVNEGWLGNGSRYNPYSISNYEIISTGPSGIYIGNVNVSYIIENNHISGVTNTGDGEAGITIHGNSYLQRILIQNNTIELSIEGIYSTASNVEIINNFFSNLGYRGIYINSADNYTIVSNIVENAAGGITLQKSAGNNVSHNLFINVNSGIVINSAGSDNNSINYNKFENCNNLAILQSNGRHTQIFRNTMNNCFESIWIQGFQYGNASVYENIYFESRTRDDSSGPNTNNWNKNLYSDHNKPGDYLIFGTRGASDTNPLPLNHDFDDDGISDLQEIQDGSNPFDSNDFIINNTLISTNTISQSEGATISQSEGATISQSEGVTTSQYVEMSDSINSPSSNFLLIVVGISAIGSLGFVLFFLYKRRNQLIGHDMKSGQKQDKFKSELESIKKELPTVNAKTCPSCGSLNAVESVFCIECGLSI